MNDLAIPVLKAGVTAFSTPVAGDDPQHTSWIRLDLIDPSTTNQRKRFFAETITELAASIKKFGVLQPVILRPHPKRPGRYELIAGERRFRACVEAETVGIPARVLDVGDMEALELQVIENLQREDLHPLEEAEGYEQLLATHKNLTGYSVDDVAARLGKSRAYIYARLKLCALTPAGREAFYAAKLNASTALLLARIPTASLQDKALAEISGAYNGPMSYRDASHHIQQRYMLRLDQAKFTVTDASLVPSAGACGDCSKRTGANPELFGDVSSADVCTDPDCHEVKTVTHRANEKALAEQNGQQIIEGKHAEKIYPYSYGEPKGYVAADDKCWQVEGGKTYKKLLGKDLPEAVLVEHPRTKELVSLIPEAAIKQALRDKGHQVSRATTAENDKTRKEEAARVIEREYRRQTLTAIRTRLAERLDDGQPLMAEDMAMIAGRFLHELWSEAADKVRKLWAPRLDGKELNKETVHDLPAADLALLMMDCALASELMVSTWSSDSRPVRIEETAIRYGVDAPEIKRTVHAAAKAAAKAKAAKSAPKKVAAKATPAKSDVTPPKKTTKPRKTKLSKAANNTSAAPDHADNQAVDGGGIDAADAALPMDSSIDIGTISDAAPAKAAATPSTKVRTARKPRMVFTPAPDGSLVGAPAGGPESEAA